MVMSNDLEHLDDYPAQGVVSAEAALVRAWSSLENFHADLVVVGGLAVYFHTRDKIDPLYRPTATLDVDFGITLAADAGFAAPAAFALKMAGFDEDNKGRMYRLTEYGMLYLDFLTDHPPATSGTRNVSDLNTSVCPGINRALSAPIKRMVSGIDHYGDQRNFSIPFCNYGSLLVLKLNAFAQRMSPKRAKDAYDILSLVLSNKEGPEEAVTSFTQEKSSDNLGLKLALDTLETHFTEPDQLGPSLAASFYLGSQDNKGLSLRLREDLVTVGRALLHS
jgi:hypothetical protein